MCGTGGRLQSGHHREHFSHSSTGKMSKIQRSRKISGCSRFCGLRGVSGDNGETVGRTLLRRRKATCADTRLRLAAKRSAGVRESVPPASRFRGIGRLTGLPEKVEGIIEAAADRFELVLQTVDPSGSLFGARLGMGPGLGREGPYDHCDFIERSGRLLRQVSVRDLGLIENGIHRTCTVLDLFV
jgi:hypothetical protein